MGKSVEAQKATADYRWPWQVATVVRRVQDNLVQFVGEAFETHGDQVRFRVGPRSIYRTRSAEDAQRILVDDSKNYIKPSSGLGVDAIKTLLGGGGLLMLNGETWRRHRRMIQPALMRSRIAGYADVMRQVAAEHVARLPDTPQDAELHAFFSELTMDLVCRLLFDVHVGEQYQAIRDRLKKVSATMAEAASVPAWAPTPANRRYKAAVAEVDRFIFELVDERMKCSRDVLLDRTDVLSTLVASVDEESTAEAGRAFTRQELRNELVTLFLAGHDTTSLALTWAAREVGLNQDVDDALDAERRAGDARPYREATMDETLRLYPSAFAFMRETVAPVELGPFDVPAGSNIAVWSIFIHRSEAYWANPLRFDPERFLGDTRPAPGTYVPFGGGTRVCIGKHFALLEANIILEALLERFRIDASGAGPVHFATGPTLAPRFGMPVRLTPR